MLLLFGIKKYTVVVLVRLLLKGVMWLLQFIVHSQTVCVVVL